MLTTTKTATISFLKYLAKYETKALLYFISVINMEFFQTWISCSHSSKKTCAGIYYSLGHPYKKISIQKPTTFSHSKKENKNIDLVPSHTISLHSQHFQKKSLACQPPHRAQLMYSLRTSPPPWRKTCCLLTNASKFCKRKSPPTAKDSPILSLPSIFDFYPILPPIEPPRG